MRVRRQTGYEHKFTCKASKSPTPRDLEWAAGFMEGEGCFTSYDGTQHINVTQVNKEPVEKLLQFFGGSLRQRDLAKLRKQPIWIWRASGSRARGIMMTLYTLLSAKRKEQIREALAA